VGKGGKMQNAAVGKGDKMQNSVVGRGGKMQNAAGGKGLRVSVFGVTGYRFLFHGKR